MLRLNHRYTKKITSSPCSYSYENLLVFDTFHEEPLSYTESNYSTSNSDSRTSSSENDSFISSTTSSRTSDSSNDSNSYLSLNDLMNRPFINTHKSLLDLDKYVLKVENDLKKQSESMKQLDKQYEKLKQLEKQNEVLKCK
ncbi:hypothetical protein F8M41_022392 [Gigaspora margarita]|uniref:Uncharacterized protein n=1 Tax=Gigaspora margarita TaxID=4874 RepID=A0A8H4AF44_GIGMA|nr:hypothetical protein F8M41_022392 [Gigaspora margarita]